MDAVYAAFGAGSRTSSGQLQKVAIACKSPGDIGLFLDALKDCTDRVMAAPDIDTGTLFQIVVAGATAASCRAVVPLIDHILSRCDAKDKNVRQRCCALIATLLESLPKTFDFPDASWEKLTNTLLARATDKAPLVRQTAISALQWLQNDSEPDTCPVVAAIRWAAAHDTSAEARSSAVACMQVYLSSIPHLLARTEDVSPSVRAAALTRVRICSMWARLTPHQRRKLLARGLSDTSYDVRRACALLCASWLGACAWDLEGLLEGVDVVAEYAGAMGGPGGEGDTSLPDRVVAAERMAESLLTALFSFVEEGQPRGAVLVADVNGEDEGGSHQPLSLAMLWARTRESVSTWVPSVSECTPEAALFWRVRAAWLMSHNSHGGGQGLGAGPLPVHISDKIQPAMREAALDSLLPDAQAWAGLLSGVVRELGQCIEGPGTGAHGGLKPSDMRVGPSSGTQGQAGSQAHTAAVTALQALALAHAVPIPSSLACITGMPGQDVDPAIPCALRQLLLLGQLLDYSDPAGRSAAVCTLMQMLPHPSTPAWAISIAVQALSIALGAGQPTGALGRDAAAAVAATSHSQAAVDAAATGLNTMVPLLLVSVGSLLAAAQLSRTNAHARERSDEAGPSSADNTLQMQAEQLRQEVERAEDEAEDASTKAARTAALARASAARKALEDVEIALADAGPTLGHGGMVGGMLQEGFVKISPEELAAALTARAAALMAELLCCENVPPTVMSSVLPVHIASTVPLCITVDTGKAASSSGAHLLVEAFWPLLDRHAHGVPPSSFVNATRIMSMMALGSAREDGTAMLNRVMPTWCAVAQGGPGVVAVAARVAAIDAIADACAVFGTDHASIASVDGAISPQALCASLLHPLSAMALTTASSSSSVPLPVQAAAARALTQFLLTGAVTCDEAAVAAAWPIRRDNDNKLGTAGAGKVNAVSVLTTLFELYYALLWRRASGSVAEETDSDGSSVSDGAGSAALVTGLLPSLFTSYAALSATHKAAVLCACMNGVSRLSSVALALSLDARAANMNGVGAMTRSHGVLAGAGTYAEDEEDGNKENGGADEDEDDGFARKGKAEKGKAAPPPVPKAPKTKGQSTGDDDARSVASAGGASSSAATFGLGLGSVWVASSLHLLLAVLDVTPMSKAFPGIAGGGEPVGIVTEIGCHTALPPGTLPASCTPSGEGVPASAAIAAWLALEAAAEARELGIAAPMVPALVATLRQVPLPQTNAMSFMHTVTGAALGQELTRLPMRGGAAAEKTLKKLTEQWASPGVATGAPSDMVKACISARVAARKAETITARTDAAGVPAPRGVVAAAPIAARQSSRVQASSRASYVGMDDDEEDDE